MRIVFYRRLLDRMVEVPCTSSPIESALRSASLDLVLVEAVVEVGGKVWSGMK